MDPKSNLKALKSLLEASWSHRKAKKLNLKKTALAAARAVFCHLGSSKRPQRALLRALKRRKERQRRERRTEEKKEVKLGGFKS